LAIQGGFKSLRTGADFLSQQAKQLVPGRAAAQKFCQTWKECYLLSAEIANIRSRQRE
jgi:hypothetical protein